MSLKIIGAGIINKEHSVLEIQKVSYPPQVKSKEKVEMDPEALWEALIKACWLLNRKDRINAIVLSFVSS